MERRLACDNGLRRGGCERVNEGAGAVCDVHGGERASGEGCRPQRCECGVFRRGDLRVATCCYNFNT
ncbi:hypothetical protein B0H19DRAFT_1129710 [Mycena capillaripes]|nr:hypothetical protein B0H19DRAFT_1129710 [Mycena capillaripes]